MAAENEGAWRSVGGAFNAFSWVLLNLDHYQWARSSNATTTPVGVVDCNLAILTSFASLRVQFTLIIVNRMS